MSRLRERGGVGDSTPAAVGGRLGQYIAPKYVIRDWCSWDCFGESKGFGELHSPKFNQLPAV